MGKAYAILLINLFLKERCFCFLMEDSSGSLFLVYEVQEEDPEK